MKYLSLLILLVGLNTHAATVVPADKSTEVELGHKDCKTESEDRGILYQQEICVLKVTCDTFPMNDPEKTVKATEQAFCKRITSSNTCPEAQACLDAKQFTKRDQAVVMMKYTERKLEPLKSTGADGKEAKEANTCPCDVDKSKRADGSKRSDGPAKPSADAPEKRAESSDRKGVQ